MRTLRLLLVTAVLLAAVWFGIREGLNGFRGAETTFQRIAAVCQVLYGALAIVVLGALYTHQRWLRPVLIAWAGALTLTGGLSPVAWAGSPWYGGLFSGALTAAVAALVVWGALAHARGNPNLAVTSGIE